MRESGRGSNARSCNRMDDVVIELRQRRVALTSVCGAPRRPERCLPTCLPRRDKIQSARVHPDRDTVRVHAGTRGSNTSVPVRKGRSARTAVTLPAHVTLISATPGSGKHCATRDRPWSTRDLSNNNLCASRSGACCQRTPCAQTACWGSVGRWTKRPSTVYSASVACSASPFGSLERTASGHGKRLRDGQTRQRNSIQRTRRACIKLARYRSHLLNSPAVPFFGP